MSSFADDTKLWRGIQTHECETSLQNELDQIYRWAEANNMEFNTKKFQAIRFNEALGECRYKGSDGTNIEQIKTVRDLGLHITEDLSFNHHIHTLIKRGNQMAGWILRVFRGRSRDLLVPLLKQLIIPRVEYCSILWSPSSQMLIQRLESVQKNFTSKILFGGDNERKNYWERLAELKLYSLQRRRDRYCILYTWKVLHGIYPNPGIGLNHVFQAIHEARPNRGIDIATINERTKEITAGHFIPENSRLSSHSILKRCCDLYNQIPSQMRTLLTGNGSPSLDKFKAKLDTWLQKLPDQPTIPGHHRLVQTNSIIHQKEFGTN